MSNLQIIVNMDMQTGKIEVTGPLHVKPLVCKALALAITAVIDSQPAQPGVVPLPNGNGGAK